MLHFKIDTALTPPDQFARLAAGAQRRGLGLSLADLQIAAIADYYGAIIATRSDQHFEHEGVVVINPWQEN
jgi:predicted nucleic acid-binding protein